MGDVQIPAPRGLRGYLATPGSRGPWPGAVVIHDAGGIDNEALVGVCSASQEGQERPDGDHRGQLPATTSGPQVSARPRQTMSR